MNTEGRGIVRQFGDFGVPVMQTKKQLLQNPSIILCYDNYYIAFTFRF